MASGDGLDAGVPVEAERAIRVHGARQHNLKNIDVAVPRDRFVVVTGLSGSGKSSLAFDTIYAEGQRRYVESLSAYARQFLEQMQKPDVEHIEGLPPTISIEQRSGTPSPRSTVATTTEVSDYLRLLYARVGDPHCHKCGRPISQQTPEQIVDAALELGEGRRIVVMAPVVRGRKGEHRDVFSRIRREGFVRARVDGEMTDLRETPKLAKTKTHEIDAVIDRLVVKPGLRPRLNDSVETALKLGEGLIVVAHEEDGAWVDRVFSQLYACPDCHIGFEELVPRMFSFNSPYGACPTCDGLGTTMEFDPDLLVPDRSKSLDAGAIQPWRQTAGPMRRRYRRWLRKFSQQREFDLKTPFAELPPAIQKVVFAGQKRKGGFPGVVPDLQRRMARTESENVRRRLMGYMNEHACTGCAGARLRPESLAVTIDGKSIHDVTGMTVDAAHGFFQSLRLPGTRAVVARPILKEVRNRLRFMRDVGLGYLTLDRTSATLSGGEAQRIRLATQVGSGLVGVCYVLDEPSIGLHQRDNDRLIDTLRRLKDLGNTVIVVEHDEATIRAAEYVVDLGPGAGEAGGHLVACGTVEQVMSEPASLTGAYLAGREHIPVPDRRRPVRRTRQVEVRGACQNNLRHIDVAFPLGVFTCVTGVSGSGKSTLVIETLRKGLARLLHGSRERPGEHDHIAGSERIDKVIEIDQSPIGRTPRSNAATYTGVFDLIRQLFARLKDAKVRGYKPGRFSFNVKGGRCEACQGQGLKKIEMHFLPDIHVTCQECRGRRFNRETLEIRYRGKTIADVLDLPVTDALRFFENIPRIHRMLGTLSDVGLGYLALGQSSTTLSGGEAQRVKLATELGRVATGKTLYILDEPTTGLHFADIHNLLGVLNRLADVGNTILVIEHHLDVIKSADWIIDLGPEGGDAGGTVVTCGTPEQVADHPTSFTGRYLKTCLAAGR